MLTSDEIIRQFLLEFWGDRVWQIEQTILGVQVCDGGGPLANLEQRLLDGPAGEEWRLLARAAAGELVDSPDMRGEVYETCQKWAEWLFAAPGLGCSYHIPDQWYESPAGAIWAAALVWSQGDELISIAEAARLTGTSVSTIASRVSRGQLRAFVNPNARERQGRRLVRKGDVLAGEP